MDSLRKRSIRQPLRETSGNVPSPNKKRVKLDGSVPGPAAGIGGGAGVQAAAVSKDLELKPALALQPVSNNKTVIRPQKVDRAKTNRLVGDELSEWRSNWRKIMKSSVVYFDTQGVDTHNSHHMSDQKRANKGLRYVGSLVVPFYDKDVTIIVSRRPYNPQIQYPSNDIFHDASNLKIKVWNFDKVFRFLKNLGVNDHEFMNDNHDNGDLVNLLKEEKIFGSTDKDPNARREDFHYLDNNYLYVYDLSQNVRPIAVREWYDDDFPRFHLTLDGKCPFIQDSENTERKRIRRQKKFQESADYRHMLKVMAYEIVKNHKDRRISTSSLLTSSDHGSNHNSHRSRNNDTDVDDQHNDTNKNNDNDSMRDKNGSTGQNMVDSDNDSTISQGSNDNEINTNNKTLDDFKRPKPSLIRNSSCLPTNNSNRFYDVAASGFNGTSAAVQSIDSGTLPGFGGNGLGPTMSQVPSKNINNLKRRIFMKKQKQLEQQPDKEMRPGYCENCRIKYDHFEDHIASGRHRRFALDDSNFKEIDNLIRTVNENKLFGFIPSDGDFSYTE